MLLNQTAGSHVTEVNALLIDRGKNQTSDP